MPALRVQLLTGTETGTGTGTEGHGWRLRVGSTLQPTVLLCSCAAKTYAQQLISLVQLIMCRRYFVNQGNPSVRLKERYQAILWARPGPWLGPNSFRCFVKTLSFSQPQKRTLYATFSQRLQITQHPIRPRTLHSVQLFALVL